MLQLSSLAEAEHMIGGGWRVLDVGSGDRPFPLATVLLDRLPRALETAAGVSAENPSTRIVRDGKPFVAGELEALPFADGSFDFVYASHVLEHVADPARALAELERVAPRGYIECPRAWFEFVDASPFHRWLIDLVEGELWFRPKTEPEAAFMQARRLFDASPALFDRFYGAVFGHVDSGGQSVEKSVCHVCVYWEQTIPFRLLPSVTYRDAPPPS
jgi:SAM-dependent methyltransferase